MCTPDPALSPFVPGLRVAVTYAQFAPVMQLVPLPQDTVDRAFRGQIPAFGQELRDDFIWRLIPEPRFIADRYDRFPGFLWHFSRNGFL